VNGTIVYNGSFLKPQTGKNNEVGLSYNDQKLNTRISLFRNDLHNEIYYDKYGVYGWGGNINLDPTRHQGIEAHVGYQLAPKLRITANYSYTEATFTEVNIQVSIYLQFQKYWKFTGHS